MNWLNYHHLYYFWVVAKEGSIAKATQKLRLAQPTISAQLKSFEQALEGKLFEREGRGLKLTETGSQVYSYAEEIFSLGNEMLASLKGMITPQVKLRVGIADVLPKIIAHRLIEPALKLPEKIQLSCHEDRHENLLAKLALHELDIILSDAPANPHIKIKAFNHMLGECGVTIFGSESLYKKFKRNFPRSLVQAPFLLPSSGTVLRKSLDQWLDENDISVSIVGEFDDSALIKVFGEAGRGLFAVPSVIADDVKRFHQVKILGRIPQIREKFYAITMERKIKNPAAIAICQSARERFEK